MSDEKVERTRKIQNIGGSLYLSFPSHFFTSGMHKGVQLELVEKGKDYTIVIIKEVKEDDAREHNKGDKTSGENP